MIAAGLAVREPAQEAGQVGEILAACRLAPNALVLLGWQRESPALEGTAVLHHAGAQPGHFKRVAWTTSFRGGAAHCFIVAVQLPSPAIQAGATLLMAGRRGKRDEVLARLPASFLEAPDIALQLAQAVSVPAAPAVARFLLDTLLPAIKAGNSVASTLLVSFLDRASTDDGCIEMLGGVRDHCALLQGWGRPLQGGCDAILAGGSISLHAVREATFMRPDIAEPATGQALVLAAEAAQAGAVECVYLLAHDGIRRRLVLAERRILSEVETAGHLRDLLSLIRCHADTRERLTAALRPRYDGQLTLYQRGDPIRLTIDLAMSAPGAGCYLTGWMYDPARLVASVRLRSTLGACVGLDDRWTAILRPDVTAGFATDSSLPPGEPGWHHHGFAVHVLELGAPSSAEHFYLEVELRDGWCGFVPLVCARIVGEPGCARLLASVDLYLPSGDEVIERHVAPFLGKIPAAAVSPPAGAKLGWSTLILVPMNTSAPPRALLSHLLADPLDASEGLLFVCSAAWTDREISRLEKLARFYAGKAVVVRRVEAAATLRAALTIAATLSVAEQILLLEEGAIGAAPGWRRALQRVARDGGAGCVSPTVLYEDRSIRFAGAGHLEATTTGSILRLPRPLAGLPASFAPLAPAIPTEGISTACCLITRQALEQLLTTPTTEVAAHWAPEFEWLHQVQCAGIACLWASAVQVYAPDLPAEESPLSRARTTIGRLSIRAELAGAGE